MAGLKGTFFVSSLIGALAVLGVAAWSATRSVPVKPTQLTDGIWIAEQVLPDQVVDLKARGFHAIVDLRPDGEDPVQPSSAAMESAARANGLAFTYLPVAHGDIPLLAVDTLQQTLDHSVRPVLLYCRSGRRAARTWALAEATRSGGLDAEQIVRSVASAGQSVDDLLSGIQSRVAARSASP